MGATSASMRPSPPLSGRSYETSAYKVAIWVWSQWMLAQPAEQFSVSTTRARRWGRSGTAPRAR